jgi:hypothetical protein
MQLEGWKTKHIMDAFSLIQRFFTQMQCPHCGAHLNEGGIRLLREDGEMYLVHVECHACHTEIGNAMVGMETPMNTMLRNAMNSDSEIVFDITDDDDDDNDSRVDEALFDGDPDEVARLMDRLKRADQPPRFAGAAGLGSLRRRYQDPEITAQERERLSTFKPIDLDDVLEAHNFFEGLGRNWQQFIPEEMRQSKITIEE